MGKQKISYIWIVFCVGILWSSCTITKRYHNTGFHVEWRKNYWNKNQIAQATTDTVNQEIAFVLDEVPLVAHISDKHEIPDILVNKPTPIVSLDEQKAKNPKKNNRLQKNIVENKAEQTKVANPIKEKKSQRKEKPELGDEKPKVELFTWITLGVVALALLFLAILILSGYVSIFLFSVKFYSVLLIVLATIFMAASIMSIIRILLDPKKYRAKWLSWIFFSITVFLLIRFLLEYIYNYP